MIIVIILNDDHSSSSSSSSSSSNNTPLPFTTGPPNLCSVYIYIYIYIYIYKIVPVRLSVGTAHPRSAESVSCILILCRICDIYNTRSY